MKYYKENNNNNNYKENIRNLIRKHIKRILILGNERKRNQYIINNNEYESFPSNNKIDNEKFLKIAIYIENLLFFQSSNFNEYSNIETLPHRLKKLALQYYQYDNCESKDYSTYENNHKNNHHQNSNQNENELLNSNDIKKKTYSLSDPVFVCLPFHLRENYHEEEKVFFQISKPSISNSQPHSRVFRAEFQYHSPT